MDLQAKSPVGSSLEDDGGLPLWLGQSSGSYDVEEDSFSVALRRRRAVRTPTDQFPQSLRSRDTSAVGIALELGHGKEPSPERRFKSPLHRLGVDDGAEIEKRSGRRGDPQSVLEGDLVLAHVCHPSHPLESGVMPIRDRYLDVCGFGEVDSIELP
jgi:hypothetical protein